MLRYDVIDGTAGRRAAELVLGLADKLHLGHLHADDCHHAFAKIIALQVLIFLLEQLRPARIIVHHTRISRLESGLMRSSAPGRN
ncbi:hypothetical protein D3C73_894340 [compost metagenome]